MTALETRSGEGPGQDIDARVYSAVDRVMRLARVAAALDGVFYPSDRELELRAEWFLAKGMGTTQ